MKTIKITLIQVFLLLIVQGTCFGQIIISQVYEGTSYNKYIELYNAGTTSVNLASPQLIIKLFTNKVDIGTNTPNYSVNLSGTIAPGQCFLIRHSQAISPTYALTYLPGDTNMVANFNGTGATSNPTASTDIIALYNGTILLDVFAWGTFQYPNVSYYRNSIIVSPNPVWNLNEWTMVTNADVDGASSNEHARLGWHHASGTSAGSDVTITCGSEIQLNSFTNLTGNLTYVWLPNIGLNNNTIANPIASPSTTTSYNLLVTNGTQTAFDTVTVFVTPLTINAGTDKTIICGGSVQLDNVSSNYTGTGNLTYLWSPSAGLNSINIINPVSSAISNTKYHVLASTSNGCSAIDSVNVNVNPLVADAGGNKTIICGGSAQLDNVLTNYTGTGTLTYQWTPLSGLNSYNIANPIAIVTSNKKYFVAVSTPNGCVATDSVTVNVNPLIVDVNNTSTTCGTPVILNTTNNYTGSGTLTYNWQPSVGLSATNVYNPSANPGSVTTYSVTLATPNGCIATDQATITLDPLPAEQICYVEFDTTTQKNSINWATNLSANIDSVYIYNEVSTNVWNLIGTEPNGLSYFIDNNSNPFNQSYSYKISVKDTCGYTTTFSAFHTTVTLLAAYDQGTNTYGFTWSAYEGLNIANYYLYGIAASGAKTLIGSVPGNQYFYNYTNPNLGFLKYFIGSNTPVCSSKTDHLVRSNYVQSTITNIAETADINNQITIYPNPVNDLLQIQTALNLKSVEITDLTGRLMSTTSQKTIDCIGLANGVYFIRVETEKGIVVKKFVKE